MKQIEYIEFLKEQLKKFEGRFITGEIHVMNSFYDEGDFDVTFAYHIKEVEGFIRVSHWFEKKLQDFLNEEIDREWHVRTNLIINDDPALWHTTITNC
jgi:hypothetical protein